MKGILPILGIIFITLKLLGIDPVSQWSWWVVLSPWMSVAILWVLVLLIAVTRAR